MSFFVNVLLKCKQTWRAMTHNRAVCDVPTSLRRDKLRSGSNIYDTTNRVISVTLFATSTQSAVPGRYVHWRRGALRRSSCQSVRMNCTIHQCASIRFRTQQLMHLGNMDENKSSLTHDMQQASMQQASSLMAIAPRLTTPRSAIHLVPGLCRQHSSLSQ